MSKKLSVQFAGLELSSPIIVAAGPWTTTVRQVEDLAKAGAGAIVAKTTFLEEEYKEVVKPFAPHQFPDVRPSYVKAADDTYVWIAGYNRLPAELWAEIITEMKRKVGIPIIASQIATTKNSYVKLAQLFQSAGADALEFDLVCPLPFVLRMEVGGLRASFPP